MRTFVPLAKEYTNQVVGGWYLSEKLDGQRCLWDGGISRGLPVSDVPWANVDKEDRLNSERISSGLWTRYGHPIIAPDFWLDQLPNIPLDGELYLGRGMFQGLRSIISRLEPYGPDWERVSFLVFDSPSYSEIFENGKINEPNFKKTINVSMLDKFIEAGKVNATSPKPFEVKLRYLAVKLANLDFASLHVQEKLPYEDLVAKEIIDNRLEEVLGLGGEGLMLRESTSFWLPKRSDSLLKVKELKDSEATVVGYRAAEIGKLHGLMGSLIVQFRRIQFELSGFTDEERCLSAEATHWAKSCPGKVLPTSFGSASKHFPLHSQVTFKYRELTNDGIPREARYLRKV